MTQTNVSNSYYSSYYALVVCVYVTNCYTLDDANNRFSSTTRTCVCVLRQIHLPRGDKLLILSEPLSITSASDWVDEANLFSPSNKQTSFLEATQREVAVSLWCLASPRVNSCHNEPRRLAFTRRGMCHIVVCCQQPARLTVEPAHRTVSILNYGVCA